jgi:heme/copper-type cytochrome/quinol oxidase subunit 1
MRRALPWGTSVAGLVLVVAGLVVFVVANRAPVGDFGWASYAPLEAGEPGPYTSALTLSFDDGWTVLATGRHLLAAGLVVAGLLVLSALGGWLLGRRSGRVS